MMRSFRCFPTTVAVSSSSFFASAPLSLFSARAAATGRQQQQITFYERLGVSRTASQEEIKKQFRVRALKTHPDLAPAKEKTRAETEFRLIAEAYETLSVPQKRKSYDAKIGTAAATTTKRATATSKKATTTTTRRSASATQQKKQQTTATATTSTAKKSFSSQFVSKDAQRVFREVFGGKSVHDVLFSQEFERRHGKKSPIAAAGAAAVPRSKATATATAEPKSSSKKSNISDNDDGDDQQWQRMFKKTQQEIFEQFREKHPFANPRDVRIGLSRAGYQPAEPPGTEFPFRPCASLRFPDHVSPGREVQVTAGVPADFDGTQVEAVSQKPGLGRAKGQNWRGDEALDAKDPESQAALLRNYNRAPHNEGQLYSFRRPY